MPWHDKMKQDTRERQKNWTVKLIKEVHTPTMTLEDIEFNVLLLLIIFFLYFGKRFYVNSFLVCWVYH